MRCGPTAPSEIAGRQAPGAAVLVLVALVLTACGARPTPVHEFQFFAMAIAALMRRPPATSDLRWNGREVQGTNPAVQFDLGADAKGDAVDRASHTCAVRGSQTRWSMPAAICAPSDAVASGPGASAYAGPALPACSGPSSWVKTKVS
ncbi:MAG: hypothetical protein M3461_23165 [Pseudomonadota bacterium]|nr:hypothetical protein [Pseudomonadota bacterium]